MHTTLIHYNKIITNNHFIITLNNHKIIINNHEIIKNNYLHKSQTIINNHKIIKNCQWWYLLGRTSGGFCDVDLHFVVVVVILHLLMFFIHSFFSTSSLTLPWTIARFLDRFCTFNPAHHIVICNTFIFQPFRYLLSRALQFWVRIFYSQAFFTFFTLLAHSQHFGTTCFYKGFTGSPQLLSWKLQGFLLILKTQSRPIYLFDSQ